MLFHRWLRWSATLLGAATASSVMAAEVESAPQVAEGFIYVPGQSGEAGCLPSTAARAALLETTAEALATVDADPDFVVILTTNVLTCPAIFYLPVKNDVRGIGYARQHESELFDDAPGRRLQGVAFLNDLPYWLDNEAEFESAFLHELGHRWLARVHATVDGADVDLTGRGGDHWSYFLDSVGSPLEGNAWQPGAEAGEAVAETPSFPVRYSPLDLYLMGAYDPDEVGPVRLFEPELAGELDCSERRLGPASSPQTCGALELGGTWLPLDIDHIVAAEGPRLPSRADSPSQFSVAFLVLDPGGQGFEQAACQEVGDWAQRLTALFSQATDGRLEMENVALGGLDCEELAFAATPPPTSGCQFGRPPQRRSWWMPLSLALVVLVGCARRRTAADAEVQLNQREGVA